MEVIRIVTNHLKSICCLTYQSGPRKVLASNMLRIRNYSLVIRFPHILTKLLHKFSRKFNLLNNPGRLVTFLNRAFYLIFSTNMALCVLATLKVVQDKYFFLHNFIAISLKLTNKNKVRLCCIFDQKYDY